MPDPIQRVTLSARTGSDRPSRLRRGGAVLLALLAGSVLSACDGSSETEQALTDAGRKLALVQTGADPGTGDSPARKAYAEVRTSLEKVKSAGLPGEVAAANLMIAQTHLGDALLNGHRAVDLLGEAALRRSSIRTELSLWHRVRNEAQAAEAFDATERIAAAQAELAEAEREKGELTQQRAAVQEQIAKLDARRQSLEQEVNTLRVERGQFILTIPPEPSQQRLEMVRQSRLQERHEQAIEFNITGLVTQIEALQPEVQRLSSEIAQRDREMEIVRGVMNEIEAQRNAAEQKARAKNAEARGLATNIRARLFGGTVTPLGGETQEVDGLHPFRTGPLAESISNTASAYDRARQTAQSASSKLGPQARMAMDRASSGLAQLHGAAWQSAWSYAQLLEELRAVGPLAGSPEFTAALKQARIDEMQALVSFAEAAGTAGETVSAHAQAALAALQAEPVSETVYRDSAAKARTAYSQAVDALAADAEAQAVDAGPTDDQFAAAGGSGDPAIDATLNRFMDAIRAASLSSASDLFAFDTPEQQQLFTAMLPMMDALIGLEMACQEQFGEGLSGAMGGGGMVGAEGPDFAALSTMTAADLQVTINGDRATATLPDASGDPLELVNRNGAWLIDMSGQLGPQLEAADPQALQMMQAMLPMMTQSFTRLTQRVRAGEFGSIDEVAEALMQGMMGGG
ncbi:MAG: hypothetical protein ACF8SC_08505 [Phycisphaerales bacterium JB037]